MDGDESWPLYGAELATVCAIGEELLFSLTPEPENRKRMLFESHQKPFYLSKDESDAYKEIIRGELAKLQSLDTEGLDGRQKGSVSAAIDQLEFTLNVDHLTSDDWYGALGANDLLKRGKVPWEPSDGFSYE